MKEQFSITLREGHMLFREAEKEWGEEEGSIEVRSEEELTLWAFMLSTSLTQSIK